MAEWIPPGGALASAAGPANRLSREPGRVPAIPVNVQDSKPHRSLCGKVSCRLGYRVLAENATPKQSKTGRIASLAPNVNPRVTLDPRIPSENRPVSPADRPHPAAIRDDVIRVDHPARPTPRSRSDTSATHGRSRREEMIAARGGLHGKDGSIPIHGDDPGRKPTRGGPRWRAAPRLTRGPERISREPSRRSPRPCSWAPRRSARTACCTRRGPATWTAAWCCSRTSPTAAPGR